MKTCKFDRGWSGPCKKAATDGDFCKEHAALRCVVCGGQATQECDHTFTQFVCGQPLCEKHSHEDESAKHAKPASVTDPWEDKIVVALVRAAHKGDATALPALLDRLLTLEIDVIPTDQDKLRRADMSRREDDGMLHSVYWPRWMTTHGSHGVVRDWYDRITSEEPTP